jgi:L-ascorbate metabolism protein UlaG (beta-lactamase superfamily)
MKITKYVHSCLLIETPERVGIIDPGQFSWESGLVTVDTLERLDDIIITHEHFDHFHLPFVQALLTKFPQAQIMTNPAVVAKLAEVGIAAQTTGNNSSELFATNHEGLAPLGTPPQHIGVHYMGKLTHPGDSHHFTQTKEVLALPVTAPWGSMINAAAVGSQLKPKYIIPIHDWHWNKTARQNAYNTLETFFRKQGIAFLKPVDGQAMSID